MTSNGRLPKIAKFQYLTKTNIINEDDHNMEEKKYPLIKYNPKLNILKLRPMRRILKCQIFNVD